MSSFSRRSGIRSEFSGPDEASPALRNRLKQVADRYTSRGEVGIGQEGMWVSGEDVDHRLSMELARTTELDTVILRGDYHEVLSAIEFFIEEAAHAFERRSEIFEQVQRAFALSGSVYGLDWEGHVILRMEPDAAALVQEASKTLTPLAQAKGVFDAAVSGLLSRREEPKNVIRDVNLAFEDYLKSVTDEGGFGDAIDVLQRRGVLTATQAGLMGKLNGFKSETFGPSHPGSARTPTQADALWFVESVSAQVKFLGNVVGK